MTYIIGEKTDVEENLRQNISMFIYILAFGIIPFLYLIAARTCRATALKRKFCIIILIVTFGLTSLLGRIIFLKFKKNHIDDLLQRAEFALGAEIPEIKVEDLHLEIYLIIGLLIGTLFSILICKRKLINAK